jgi:hypothetical protein
MRHGTMCLYADRIFRSTCIAATLFDVVSEADRESLHDGVHYRIFIYVRPRLGTQRP